MDHLCLLPLFFVILGESASSSCKYCSTSAIPLCSSWYNSYAENDPTILKSDLTIIGLCLGLIPAAVGAVARDANELVDLGLEFLPLIIRIAVTGYERCREIEDSQGTWSYVVRDTLPEEVQIILDEFHQSNVSCSHPILAIYRKLMISEYFPTPICLPERIGTKLVHIEWSSLYS